MNNSTTMGNSATAFVYFLMSSLLSCSRMFAQVHFPGALTAEEFDKYLHQGWFRMAQSIFTTNFLHFKNEFYSAIWLRVDLSLYSTDSTQEKIFRLNNRFSWKVCKASLDSTKENLFQKYKQGISFETSPTLNHLLFGKGGNDIFNSWEVCVYDQDKLIAAGIFDLGQNAAAGIISFYDPDYKKYSLGKYLIYLKMNYCKERGLAFFYPGYFVPGYPFFDYKLQLGKTALNFFDVMKQEWYPIKSFVKSPFVIMQDKLLQLMEILTSHKIECRIFNYEFFDANLFPELKDAELFDYPVFLNCFTFNEDIVSPIIVYDVLMNRFRLLQCMSLWDSNLPKVHKEIYAFHLLKVEFEYYSCENTDEMAKKLFLEVNE
jgi:leucyl-tRNA---protein transferase